MEKEPFLMTVNLKWNNSYVLYDDYIKKFINITGFISTEDKMTSPFYETSSDYKKLRLCTDDDYSKVEISNRISSVMNLSN